jgi:hypothetical protein
MKLYIKPQSENEPQSIQGVDFHFASSETFVVQTNFGSTALLAAFFALAGNTLLRYCFGGVGKKPGRE